MPSTDEILKALTLLSNQYIGVGIFWHALVLLLLFFYSFATRKIPHSFVSLFFSLALLSVSIFAWIIGNPFNGFLFLASSLLLLFLGTKKKGIKPSVNPKPWWKIAGSFIFLSGFFYPHFLNGNWWTYSYGAPIGLVPCPTLLMISGLVLLLPFAYTKSWLLVLIVMDGFYGLFGVLKLNVYLDVLLVAATILLILQQALFRAPKGRVAEGTLATANRA